MPQIIIEIDENADTTVSVHGMKGSGCQALTAALEAALGEKTDDRKTPEFYVPPVQAKAAAKAIQR